MKGSTPKSSISSFAVNAQFLADFDLDGQPVRIPARFALAEVSPHRAVAREEVLDRAGQAVPGMRQAVGRRRTFEKDEIFRPCRCWRDFS